MVCRKSLRQTFFYADTYLPEIISQPLPNISLRGLGAFSSDHLWPRVSSRSDETVSLHGFLSVRKSLYSSHCRAGLSSGPSRKPPWSNFRKAFFDLNRQLFQQPRVLGREAHDVDMGADLLAEEWGSGVCEVGVPGEEDDVGLEGLELAG